MRSSGIDRLEVLVSWPTFKEYDDNVVYTLEDPKLIPKGDTDKWKTITCPNEIEFYLKLRNRWHFGQAETEGTPFTQPAMKEKIDWMSSTYQAELVLEGEYKDLEIDAVSMMLLRNLKQVIPEDIEQKYITAKQFKGKIKAWRENMSTSPGSG